MVIVLLAGIVVVCLALVGYLVRLVRTIPRSNEDFDVFHGDRTLDQ
jgi:hypothetical protein